MFRDRKLRVAETILLKYLRVKRAEVFKATSKLFTSEIVEIYALFFSKVLLAGLLKDDKGF